MGWEPATSLEEGLKRTVDWYEERLRANALGPLP
jgi:nucleoside-diphosphate-sugar epimerase